MTTSGCSAQILSENPQNPVESKIWCCHVGLDYSDTLVLGVCKHFCVNVPAEASLKQ
jgi:hypothetical protein